MDGEGIEEVHFCTRITRSRKSTWILAKIAWPDGSCEKLQRRNPLALQKGGDMKMKMGEAERESKTGIEGERWEDSGREGKKQGRVR